jgi:putative transcriptional regulator
MSKTKKDESVARVPPSVDIPAIRKRQGLSQNKFAERYGIPAGTLRDWEQGRVEVTTAARALLTIIDREPEAVVRALRR